MKKSEFVGGFEARAFKGPRGEPFNLDHALALAEEHGGPWDPEEPELPERVEVRRRPGVPLFLGTENGVDTADSLDAIAKEARRRWHALGRLRELVDRELRDSSTHTPGWNLAIASIKDDLDSLLQEEG